MSATITHETPLPAEARPGHVHVTPVRNYLAVYAALLVFTVLTIVVSYMDLGGAAVYVAMAVAVVKATMVAAIFMHLYHDEKFNSFILVASVLFLILFFALTMGDLTTRGALIADTDNFVMHPERAEADQQAREAAERHEVHATPAGGDH